VTEMVEIGAGGGSIARLDALGRIRVGPQSAGAEPGPVCYGRGGEEPTVTDANVVLGRIDPDAFAGGTLRLDRAGAERAVLERIGKRLELDAPWAAAGIGEIVEENMASAARVHAIERGKAAERCVMIAFGGAAPLHAARLATKLGMTKVLVPLDASVGSAVGFLRAPMAFEVVRSFALAEDEFDAGRINRLLEGMTREARAIVAAGAPQASLETRRFVEMRYRGQGHELAVPLPPRELVPEDSTGLREAYQARYEDQFGLRVADVPVEYLTWSVIVSAAPPDPEVPSAPATAEAPAPRGRRAVFDAMEGRSQALPYYLRADLLPGAKVAGPALVTEPQTTTLLPAGWDLQVAAAGHLLLEKR
jgi:N-methylhydantoinase A